MKLVQRHREAILEAIYRGTFDYAVTFPNSANAKKFAKQQGDIYLLSEYLPVWFHSRKPFLKSSTLKDYRNIVFKTLIPCFGHLSLSLLNKKAVKDWVSLQSAGAKRINNILSVLRKALHDAVEDELIEINPLYGWNYVPKEKVKKVSDVDPFDSMEQRAIIQHAPNDYYRNLFQFAFWTGLRTSELIALDWADVDFINNRISINKAITTAAQGKAETTKTASGIRMVKLLAPALTALEHQKRLSYLSYGEIFIDSRTKERIKGDRRIRDVWVSTLKKAGVRYRRPYQTRHTYASMMLSSGENPMWVASQMGHSDWTMIARVYGKWIPSADNMAGQKAVSTFVIDREHSAKKAV